MENTITVTSARHAWTEKAGFTIQRPKGLRTYTFLHFFGSVELLVDGKHIITPPDSCIIYDTNTPQWFQSSQELCHDWMHITGAVSQALAAAGLKTDTLYTPGNAKFITAITREIELETLAKGEGYAALTELKLRELFLKLGRSCRQTGCAVKPAMAAQLRGVRSQVLAQLDRPWTVKDMASLAYISASRFHSLYRQLFGISPVEDMILARMDMAKTRLSSTQEPLSAVAEALGYRNVTHFCRQFKQYTGLTPGEFRSAHQG